MAAKKGGQGGKGKGGGVNRQSRWQQRQGEGSNDGREELQGVNTGCEHRLATTARAEAKCTWPPAEARHDRKGRGDKKGRDCVRMAPTGKAGKAEA
eukprot:226898-Chlamydomonas_euryale.AAC.6